MLEGSYRQLVPGSAVYLVPTARHGGSSYRIPYVGYVGWRSDFYRGGASGSGRPLRTSRRYLSVNNFYDTAAAAAAVSLPLPEFASKPGVYVLRDVNYSNITPEDAMYCPYMCVHLCLLCIIFYVFHYAAACNDITLFYVFSVVCTYMLMCT